MSDLELAFTAIKDKEAPYRLLWTYYDGNAPLKFSTARLARAFNKSFVYFAENWGSVIIHAVLDRLILKGFDIEGQATLTTKINSLFAKYNLNLDSQDVHEALQVTGEAFLFVDEIDGVTDVYFNNPAMCEMFYDPDRPKIKLFAAKKWVATDGIFINLYYPDKTETYRSDTGVTAKSFILSNTVSNPDGIIPVFHFRNSRRIIKGEFDPASVSMIDAVNKLFSDMMVAAEFESFRTRVIISQIDPGDIKIGPDMTLWLPANESATGQDTAIQELSGSTLDGFLKPMEQIAQALAVITSTPRYYFTNVGANVSGEALTVQESQLVKKVTKRQEAYSPVWQEFIVYFLKLNGITMDADMIKPIWGTPETTQHLTEATTIKTLTDANMPLTSALKYVGKDDAEISQLGISSTATGAATTNSSATGETGAIPNG